MAANIDDQPAGGGVPFALGAYAIWGLLPLYLLAVRAVPPLELVGWRILFTVPVCLIIITARRQWPDLMRALLDRRILGWLCLSAVLIGTNWTIYLAAIDAGHVYAASLGYYINPLINVLIGTIFLKEKLSSPQWVAVGLAAAGVVILTSGALTMLWISISLAISFALYGLVRKFVPVGSLPGLTVEALILTIPAIAVLAHFAAGPNGVVFGHNHGLDLAIAMAGVVTATPLLLFAIAARRMDYSTLGFIQFLAPTIVFFLGLTVFGEPLRLTQLCSFVFIWMAIAVFAWDLWHRRSEAPGKA